MFQPGMCFTAEFNKSKYSLRMCYGKEIQCLLRICYGKWLDTLRTEFHDCPGVTPPLGQLKVIHLCINPYAQGFFRHSSSLFHFFISALNDSAALPLETPNDSERRC